LNPCAIPAKKCANDREILICCIIPKRSPQAKCTPQLVTVRIHKRNLIVRISYSRIRAACLSGKFEGHGLINVGRSNSVQEGELDKGGDVTDT